MPAIGQLEALAMAPVIALNSSLHQPVTGSRPAHRFRRNQVVHVQLVRRLEQHAAVGVSPLPSGESVAHAA